MPRTKERWRAIRGYEGLYEVSDCGRVRSLNFNHTGRTQVLKAIVSGSGYLSVTLYNIGTKKNTKVHKIVLTSFVGPRPPGLVADHIDANRTNNRVNNLRWISQSENVMRGRSPELSRTMCGSKHPNSKLTENRVIKIRKRYAAGGVTQRELGREYGMGLTTINRIIGRIWWKHVS